MKRGLATFLSLLLVGSFTIFAQDTGDALVALQNRITDLFARHQASIVRVKATRQVREEKKLKRTLKMGTGFFVSNEGHVLTSALLRDADRVGESLQPLDHEPTRFCIDTERLISAHMGGSCHLPLGAFATRDEETSLDLKAVVGDPEDGQLVFSHATGSLNDRSELAHKVVEDLLRHGADEILQRVNAIE